MVKYVPLHRIAGFSKEIVENLEFEEAGLFVSLYLLRFDIEFIVFWYSILC